MTQLTEILDLARWAPSGDNTQPWRFAIEEPVGIVACVHDKRTHCVEDLDWDASQLSVGGLLETSALSGSPVSLRKGTSKIGRSSDELPIFDVSLRNESGLPED